MVVAVAVWGGLHWRLFVGVGRRIPALCGAWCSAAIPSMTPCGSTIPPVSPMLRLAYDLFGVSMARAVAWVLVSSLAALIGTGWLSWDLVRNKWAPRWRFCCWRYRHRSCGVALGHGRCAGHGRRGAVGGGGPVGGGTAPARCLAGRGRDPLWHQPGDQAHLGLSGGAAIGGGLERDARTGDGSVVAPHGGAGATPGPAGRRCTGYGGAVHGPGGSESLCRPGAGHLCGQHRALSVEPAGESRAAVGVFFLVQVRRGAIRLPAVAGAGRRGSGAWSALDGAVGALCLAGGRYAVLAAPRAAIQPPTGDLVGAGHGVGGLWPDLRLARPGGCRPERGPIAGHGDVGIAVDAGWGRRAGGAERRLCGATRRRRGRGRATRRGAAPQGAARRCLHRDRQPGVGLRGRPRPTSHAGQSVQPGASPAAASTRNRPSPRRNSTAPPRWCSGTTAWR